MLTQRRILHYIPRKKTPFIIYTRERQEKDRIHIGREVYEDRKESYVSRIQAMIEYASAEDTCRSQMLLNYFGEKNGHHCGQCDTCLRKHASGLKLGEFLNIEEEIRKTLAESPCRQDQLVARMEANEEKINQTVHFLLSEEIIHLKEGLLYI
jgi:ATP-dependent DNA helicase RecQ